MNQCCESQNSTNHHENPKHQNTNYKWFDKLTTLSPVEGQIPMAQFQNSKQNDQI
ncbi:hypothetical protein D1BOALGB6SA_3874 [Olavius sp. associated proteobacterium Delta 1]|nr:hypothetical protein D1BOALGB6SA_3874 [Olavius sp. associated proteobacterium Delta 1]